MIKTHEITIPEGIWMKKLKLTAMLLAMLAALSVNVYADDAADVPETAEPAAEEIDITAEISFPDMLELNITSSMSAPDAPTQLLFDKLAVTGYDLTVSEESRTYTLYTALNVRDYADLLAVRMDGEPCTTVEVAVSASNDDETWVPFDVTSPTEENGFYVFDILGCEEKYAFWRIEFTVGMGDGFTLTELALFKQNKGEPEYKYDLGDSIEAGEIPDLIPVQESTQPDAELLPEKPANKFPVGGMLPFMIGFVL